MDCCLSRSEQGKPGAWMVKCCPQFQSVAIRQSPHHHLYTSSPWSIIADRLCLWLNFCSINSPAWLAFLVTIACNPSNAACVMDQEHTSARQPGSSPDWPQARVIFGLPPPLPYSFHPALSAAVSCLFSSLSFFLFCSPSNVPLSSITACWRWKNQTIPPGDMRGIFQVVATTLQLFKNILCPTGVCPMNLPPAKSSHSTETVNNLVLSGAKTFTLAIST